MGCPPRLHDLSQVFVRNYRNRGWLSAAWTHLPMVEPCSGFTRRAARRSSRSADGRHRDRPALDNMIT
jgi:hypothetical protein